MHLEQVHGVREPGDDVIDSSLGRLHHLSFNLVTRRLYHIVSYVQNTKSINTGRAMRGVVSDIAKK